MNPFLLEPEARLGDWKEFRRSLASLPEEEQINAVVAYWAKAPIVKHAYDITMPEEIPSAWQMVSDGEWCRTSVAIGMEFTLRLAGWDASRLKLRLIKDWDLSEIILILIIDESRVLNYSYGKVSVYPESRHDILGDRHFSGKLYVPEA